MYYQDDFAETFVKAIASIVLLIVLVYGCFACDSLEQTNSRDSQNMIYIKKGYCYDEESKLIYKENVIHGYREPTRTEYKIYYNSNGKKCLYENGKFVEVKDE